MEKLYIIDDLLEGTATPEIRQALYIDIPKALGLDKNTYWGTSLPPGSDELMKDTHIKEDTRERIILRYERDKQLQEILTDNESPETGLTIKETVEKRKPKKATS